MGELKQDMAGWSKWYLVKDKSRAGKPVLKIRRYKIIEGKTVWDRYPSKNYQDLAPREVESLLARLNASFEVDRKAAEDRYKFDHTYINEISLGKFRKNLEKKTSDENRINTIFQILNDYVFEFFVLQCKIPDPSRWHLKEDEWADFLLAQDLGVWTLRKIISSANRFNKFLVDKMYPEMATPRKLEPIGKSVMEEVDRNNKNRKRTKFIKDEIYVKILADADREFKDVLPNIKLCYGFGLRISETLGLTKDKFLKDSMLVDEQGDFLKDDEVIRKKVKTFERRVPYWNMTAKEAWTLVKEIKPMAPNTLIKKVNDCLSKYDHTSHDFRRTFITRSFRKAHWKDVMKAAGHVDVRTTMGYDQDDRNLSEEKADLD